MREKQDRIYGLFSLSGIQRCNRKNESQKRELVLASLNLGQVFKAENRGQRFKEQTPHPIPSLNCLLQRLWEGLQGLNLGMSAWEETFQPSLSKGRLEMMVVPTTNWKLGQGGNGHLQTWNYLSHPTPAPEKYYPTVHLHTTLSKFLLFSKKGRYMFKKKKSKPWLIEMAKNQQASTILGEFLILQILLFAHSEITASGLDAFFFPPRCLQSRSSGQYIFLFILQTWVVFSWYSKVCLWVKEQKILHKRGGPFVAQQ